MKKKFILHLLLYISLSVCVSTVDPSDSTNSNESTLVIQPTLLLSNNVSANVEVQESTSFDSKITEKQSDNSINIDPTKNNIVQERIIPEILNRNSEVFDEVINNDIPNVISNNQSAIEEVLDQQSLESSIISEDSLRRDVEEIDNITQTLKPEEDRSDFNITIAETEKLMPKNLTDKGAEDIPSFSEWAQKHLEEVEKKEQSNFSSPVQTINTTKQGSGAKLRWKNYASVDCGAKVILANPEAQNTWAILSPSRDEYKLNPCNSRIWFIVELCESIQLKKIDLANYELFSSSPKDFVLSVSDRFPTRDWSVVGQFTAKDERDVQNFDVNTETFGKYVKVEVKSHYGSEHYCPLSLFRAYGTSVFEVLQKDDPAHEQPIEDDDDDDDEETLDRPPNSGNILSSAKDAVLSMVKNVAEVLGSKVNKTEKSSHDRLERKYAAPIVKSCKSPSHYVVCNNCSDLLFGQIFELLSCSQNEIKKLISVPFISNALINSHSCKNFGFDFDDKSNNRTINARPACVESFFSSKYLGAMCNALAVTQNKVSYNVSHQYANTTGNILADSLVIMDDTATPTIIPAIEEPSGIPEQNTSYRSFIPLDDEQPDMVLKSSCSTDSTYASQIKPSKSFSSELHIDIKLNTESIKMHDSEERTNAFEEQDVSVLKTATMEVVPEMAQEIEESTEASVEESMDKFITEFSSEASPSLSTTSATASSLQGQKESVFLRLSNRIKALERNMSLSGQYLEELSKRYKKQVEEMQRVLEKTEQTLNDVAVKQDERYRKLEERLESLTDAVEVLLAEKNSWKHISYWFFFGFGFMFFVYCFNKYSSVRPEPTDATKRVEIQRSNSINVIRKTAPKKKMRRLSDQALRVVPTAASGEHDKNPKKRKKKSSNPLDSLNNEKNYKTVIPDTKFSSVDWVEDRKVIEDIPFALEESDNLLLEPLPIPLETNTIEVTSAVSSPTKLKESPTAIKNGHVRSNSDLQIPANQMFPLNGSISGTNEQTAKKEKKGIKKLLKKVF